MSARRPLVALLLALLALVLPPVASRADGPQTSTLDGRVLDPQGAALPGVTVTLSGPQERRTAVTDQNGAFRFALLPPGRYSVAASLEGLGTSEVSTDLAAGVRRGLEIELGGGTEETITVTSEAPLISKYEIGATAAVESEVAENSAFRSRLYSSTVRMLPTVVNICCTGVADSDNAPAINGGSQSETAAFLEGVDTSITRRGGELRFAIPTTSVAETRVEAAGYGAEYGRAISGVINTTIKTGTNTFHGEGLYIAQNSKWRAAYEELDIPRPDDGIHSYELNVGGPIVRDRAWFFASYADLSDNKLDQVPDGTVFNTSRDYEPRILKLNFQPGERHQIALTGIDSPSAAVFVPRQNPGDLYGLTSSGNDQSLYTGTWSIAAASSTFVEVKASSRREDVIRGELFTHDIDPAAGPDSPRGNNFRYLDLANNFRYNFAATPLGTGFNKFPRDQGNASVVHYRGKHEIKVGADYQDVEFANQTEIGSEYRGRGYDPFLPGGYATPQNKRVYTPSGVVTSTGETAAAFAQDRLDLDRWTITYGLRVDDQTVKNDVGEEVISYTKWMPRLSAVYDINGDGRLLARGTAGRYYRNVALDIATREFARLPSGNNDYDLYLWNAATGLYDRFSRHQFPVLDAVIPEFDPMYKDEVSAGVDWQLHPNWVFNSRVVWWDMSDLFWSTDQYDAAGTVVTDVRNWDAGYRKYKALTLELNRSFRQGWAFRSNYTLGKSEGNVSFLTDDDDLFEALGGVEVGTGRTDATTVNRDGRTSFDREHILNLVGLKRWSFGKHDVGLGAYYFFRSGERWGLRPNTTVAHPVSGQTINTTTYVEPRDQNQLEDIFNVNLTADWSFPISGRVRIKIGAEVANLTNEQEVVVINVANGNPSPGIIAYQVPREFRLKAGITF